MNLLKTITLFLGSLTKEDFGIDVYPNFIVAYTKKNGTYKAHFSKDNRVVARLENPQFLTLQKDVAIKIKDLRKET